ncbi:undecaprenyldiphospho-muramoylpentapeptide beta-N-acetylglucosaminyltransferase [Bacillus carboniphilus]|uniref:UDP-N-acetylglucosamine--N-acetylmuramyl-(pentapeptide) pyrophosphoryl-undecaprenol N-acetylglucosamine transferase n=1 Tax=Bacillus carboniphilus TaxID=86663 RepID=A0ABY9JVA1_9BACI|nr:undecaprenyldiphospho-muramoylpentapeptide beta-N-acetylglucosaminyltransferase [Bacillus carboniphilus]WLR42719.1 undecaprenyldiphospho-muramoylpentapeptide beta-N-acetylglucosaminyltransferase [Bacillus carboniphilus]
MNKHTIVFTGGGSAGHVTPNIAIMNELNRDKWDIHYIGSHKGIEKELIEKTNIPYHSISSGKLRRYLDKENLIDLFRVVKGISDARKHLKRLKPAVVFSKGGFVSVPVVIAARSLKIPVFLHESDLTPGLANKIANRFSTNIYTSFEEASEHFPSKKTKVVGSPIRKELLQGNVTKGLHYLDFTTQKPIILIMGGSLGASRINDVVRKALPKLLDDYQVIHLCGKGNLEPTLEGKRGYRQFEYVYDDLADLLAAADYVITRGGSNAIFEFLALKKPMVIIPLTLKQSRGDQILNAKSFEQHGYAMKLEEEELTVESLLEKLGLLKENRSMILSSMNRAKQLHAIDVIKEDLEKVI